jgi:ferric-dicitrate binding protein FerR (iron transport regulator)
MLFNNKEFETALNEATTAMRSTEPAPAAVEAAAARVWKNIAREVLETAPADLGGDIAGCADVQALLPAYRAGKLTQAREWLVQDHLRECVTCRNAAAGSRTGVVLPWRQDETTRRASLTPARKLAWAAGIVVAVGLTTWAMRDSFLPAPAGERARLESSNGPVYLLAGNTQRPLKPGEAIAEREWLRTPSGTHAFVRLRDGSRLEVSDRAELSVSMNRRDVTVHLERGMVIVEAAKQRDGHLNVSTGDAVVSVTGTVFAVNRGLKGSRVSVIEGTVRVDQPGRGRDLQAGNQFTTTAALEAVPVRDEIAWSRNVDSHLKLLEQASALARDLGNIRLPGMRYDSRILRMLPADTVVFAAVPNLGETLAQAHQIFSDRIRQSGELREWWDKHGGGAQDKPSVAELVEFVRGATEYLGDEVVIAVAQQGTNEAAVALIAEVHKQGLREYIDSQLQRLGASEERPHMYLTNSLVVLSPEADMLQRFTTPGSLGAEPFGKRITEAYREGVHVLFAADLSRLTRRMGGGDAPQALADAELKYVVVEQRQTPEGLGQTQATANFAGERRGIASWLAAPGPIGSLDYVSPGAILSASFVVKQPELIIDDLMRLAETGHKGVGDELRRMESQLGLRIREDIAASLGNDVTIAIDGQLMPPAWKFVVEVRDPARIQQAIDRLVTEYNRTAKEHKRAELVTETHQVNGRTTRQIQFGAGGLQINYAFSDGYLVLAADAGTLRRSLRAKDGGGRIRLGRYMATDQYANFSAIVYHDLSRVGMTITDALNATGSLTAEQRAQAEKLAAEARPGVIYAYAESDRIRVGSTGGFFGLTLESLLTSGGISDLLRRGGDGAMRLQRGLPRGPESAVLPKNLRPYGKNSEQQSNPSRKAN